MLKDIYTALTALSLVAVPTIAVAAPIATPLTRAATETVDGDSALAAGGFLIAGLSVVALGLGVYVASTADDSADEDAPNSP